MDRALREYRIRGVANNLLFLRSGAVTSEIPRLRLHHPLHRRDAGAVRFPRAPRPRDQAADLYRRCHASTAIPKRAAAPSRPPMRGRPSRRISRRRRAAGHASNCSTSSARKAFAAWMRKEKRVLVTDTTMRDAHQSLLATRMRTYDIARGRRRLCARPAATVLARMLGRRDVRRRDALSVRRPVGAARAVARKGAEHPDADAAARRQRRRLHQLSRQCRAPFRAAGGRGGHRSVPDLRLPQLGREHARRDRRGAANRQARRGRDLLHRRPARSGPRQIFASPTTSASPRRSRAPAAISSASRTWRAC